MFRDTGQLRTGAKIASLCAALISVFCGTVLAEAPAKVLFVGKQPDHPYGSHMYLHTCEMLAKCLALNGGIESVVSDGWPTDRAMVEGVDSIVAFGYRHCLPQVCPFWKSRKQCPAIPIRPLFSGPAVAHPRPACSWSRTFHPQGK